MTVAAVVRVLILVVILAVAKLVIQLCLQAIFHELGNGFLEQALDILHAAYVRHIQQFSDFFPTCIFFRGAILSGHNNYLQCGASILHHIGGLHKVWDGICVADWPNSIIVCNKLAHNSWYPQYSFSLLPR